MNEDTTDFSNFSYHYFIIDHVRYTRVKDFITKYVVDIYEMKSHSVVKNIVITGPTATVIRAKSLLKLMPCLKTVMAWRWENEESFERKLLSLMHTSEPFHLSNFHAGFERLTEAYCVWYCVENRNKLLEFVDQEGVQYASYENQYSHMKHRDANPPPENHGCLEVTTPLSEEQKRAIENILNEYP